MDLLNRKSCRASWHEYNGGNYFVTICTKGRNHYFGEIIDDAIQLTDIGKYLKLQIENIKTHYTYADVLLSTIMPNHIHLIIHIDGDKTPYDRRSVGTRRATSLQGNDCVINDYMRDVANQQGWLAVCIGGIKSSVTRYANENHITFGWQPRFHDHIIRNPIEMDFIVNYIENNPLIWYRDRNNIE